ncbi:MAG: protein kinase [Acidobacteria bacterium]|nr:protein kinase [Acidobacteriota bacterium]NIM61702.1 protein kinase [Acidobacteriota bacterium]NIO58184.1 protein kinase [Acidobacteriota bacterium]NIQ83749.1 protein kinase [Acidobacteriota bacterium]NIT09912.1 protein kinase [Acidobacteriota bacterium]
MSLQPGQQVLHYRLIDKIGEGGMGMVWKAEDVQLAREVALKVLPEVVARDTHRLLRFEHEARTLAALNHPNIATIHGLEQDGPLRMLVMELVQGETVAARLETGPYPFDEALPLMRQMVKALAAAHAKGIIHRDLKPANIMITPEGQVKVLDFGLAKAFEETPAEPVSDDSPTRSRSPTRPGMRVGTANYMSPEQISGQPLDQRSDLFQLGLVFSEMLAGGHPFPGPTPIDIQYAILRSGPQLEPLAGRVPDGFMRVLAKLLEKEPGYRYPDAEALEVDLRTLQRDSGSGIVPMSTSGVAVRRRTKSRRVVSIVVGAVAAIALAATWIVWTSRSTERSPILTRLVPLTQAGGDNRFPSFSPDGNSVVYTSSRGGAWDLWVTLISGGDPVQITDTPEVETDPAWSPDGSRVAFTRYGQDETTAGIYVMPALGGVARRVVDGGYDPAWSADGRWLAYVEEDEGWPRISKVALNDPGNPSPVTIAEEGFFHRHPTWSPDGEWIVFSRGAGGPSGRLVRVSSAGGSFVAITDDPQGVASFHPVFTPDGRYVVHSSDRGGTTNLWRVALGGGDPERITSGPGPDVLASMSRDGRRIVYTTDQVNPRIVAISRAGQVDVLAEFDGGTAWGPALSHDGSMLAFTRKVAGRPWAIFLMPRSGGSARALLDIPQDMMWPRFHPDGRSLIFFTWPGRQRVGRIGLDGTGLTWLTGEETEAGYPDVSPDGKRLAFVRVGGEGAPDEIIVRPLDGGEERLVAENATLPRFSPDGRWLAFAGARSFAGGVGVVDLESGEIRRLTSTGTWPAWMPDGRTIAYAEETADGLQTASVVSIDGGQPRRLGDILWTGQHYPYVVDPSSGELISADDGGGKSTIWLAEYD